MFLLTEAGFLPGRLVQTALRCNARRKDEPGYSVIDLDLSKYDRLATRFAEDAETDADRLKKHLARHGLGFGDLPKGCRW